MSAQLSEQSTTRRTIQKPKFEFLLALNVGESHSFDNKPTLTEARRKVPPSARDAYNRVCGNLSHLHRSFPEYRFSTRLGESKGSRIPGDLVVVTLVAHGSDVSSKDDADALERKRKANVEAWRQRKIAEDAPKLPEQLAQAEAVDVARRTAGAIRAQEKQRCVVSPITQKYDPKRIAELVAAQIRGETIQRRIDGAWVVDPTPTWTEPTADYRVKPRVREWFLVVGRDGRISASAEAMESLPHHDPACRVHVREVMEVEP